MKTKEEKIESPQTEIVSQGNTLVRLENTTQMTMAIQRPRDEKAILESAMQELELYKSCAEEAIYSKPVGKDETGTMKYAEGLSIRAAESLANRWCNSAYGADIIGEDEGSATIAAVFLDYEGNTRHVIQKRVSKFYKARTGQVVQYTPDRFDLILAANQSKALREVILRSLPAGLKKEYEDKARIMLEMGDIKGRIKKMILAFRKLGISQEQLESLRKISVDKFTHEDLTELLGTHNAIKDGEITIESLFGETDKKEDNKPTIKPQSSKPDKCIPCSRDIGCMLMDNPKMVENCKGPFLG